MSAAPRPTAHQNLPRLLCVGGESGNKANQYQDDNQTSLPVSTTSNVYYHHPQRCYTINTSTTDVSVYCSGHHPDCEMEDHQKTRFCRAGCNTNCAHSTSNAKLHEVYDEVIQDVTRAAGSKLARREGYQEQEWWRSNCSVCSSERAYLWVHACYVWVFRFGWLCHQKSQQPDKIL